MWNIVYYKKRDGTIPVKEFIEALPVRHRAKAVREITLLEEYGNRLTEPHAKHIEGKLWELRIKSSSDISRIFYFLHSGDDIILLHGFVKKTQKTPRREINRASEYLDDYLRRFPDGF